MAFVFTLLFIATAYITPEVLFGPLAEYRIEVLLALLAILTSLPNIARSHFSQYPQIYASVAFFLAVPVSIMVGGGVTAAADAMYGIMPLVLCLVLPAANFRTRQHLQWMTLAMICCSAYFITCGLLDLHNGVLPSNFLYGTGELRRLRGLGFVFDPNDLSQVLVSLLPLVFLWKSKNWFLNVFLLGIPLAILLTGMYFTHSRGGALALMAVIIIALRRKIGTVPAVVMAGSLFVASLAVGWSGGRDVSVEAGGDRLDAWSTGIEMIKQHPIFGVGANRFADFNDITAHNSVVVCAAELGLPGFVCWVFMIFATLRNATGLGGAKPSEEPAADSPGGAAPVAAPAVGRGALAHLQTRLAALGSSPSYLPMALASTSAAMPSPAPRALSVSAGRGSPSSLAADCSPERQEDIRRMARLLVCSLTGFLTAGWFLSRALSMWLFLYFGVTLAVVRMASDAGMLPRRDSWTFLLRWSIAISIGLLLLVYGVLKFRALTGR